MEIQLYQTSSDPREMPKILTAVGSAISGALRDETSIITPSIMVNTDPRSANYAYISEFSRYYFIEEVTSVRTGLWMIKLRCDVLETYYNKIMESPCIVERSSSLPNSYLADSERKFYQDRFNQYITIGDVGDPKTIVMVTVG